MADRIGVIGIGVMGASIAQVLATKGCDVVCHDISAEVMERARDLIESGPYGLQSGVKRGKLSSAQAEETLARLHFSPDIEQAAAVDVVIEAVPEDLDLKLALLRRLDGIAPADTILATNSSGFSVTALAGATTRPELVIGWHWASPAVVMPLAEIVRTPRTSAATVERVRGLALAAGKHPIVINDDQKTWGYVVNRVYGKARTEAQLVVDEGVATPDEVDQLMMDAFGWPVGPFGMVRGATTGWPAS